jgi:GntR family transcriptional regulator
MEQQFIVDTRDPTPIYAQLERAIRFAIATGRIRVGDRLPTVRQLAVDLKINANTVAKVYTELERTGVVETRRGIGTFVRSDHFQSSALLNRGTEEREKQLLLMGRRLFADASALGFSPAEVLERLAGIIDKGE